MHKSEISYISWGEHLGQQVYLFKIINPNGTYIELTNYGATLVSIVVPDRNGILENVILGFPEFNDYLNDPMYIGATIGRFANRIHKATFNLEGKNFFLDNNDTDHSIHGGLNGFHTKSFDFLIEEDKLSFMLYSKDGEGGYPGNLKFKVSYIWTSDRELQIEYTAESDKKTVVNFTNHSYFNLSASQNKICDHELTILSDKVLEMDADYIPTGKVVPAGENAFSNTKLKEKISCEEKPKGLNLYYISEKNKGHLELVCSLNDSGSGRKLEVYTTYPGVLLYTGDFLISENIGLHKKLYSPFDGLCLECQYYPDSPNQPEFPSTILEAGKKYNEQIVFKFL